MSHNFKRTKLACYFTYLSGASVFALPALLFMTFRELYGISYTLLGTLVVANFCTQLSIDLIFSFFAKHFNIRKVIKTTPILTALGLFIYGTAPAIFPQHAYLWLITGTFVFSLAAGLSEVFLSPIIAAIPSEHPERDMSLLHSIYAWGVVGVVLATTLFFNIFTAEKWTYLVLFYALLQFIPFALFYKSPIPEFDVSHNSSSGTHNSRKIGIILCVACIFLGSAAENVMTNWISGYMEAALNIPKSYGDILGMALFALCLGFGRTLYAKFEKNIFNVLVFGMAGSAICYIVAALSSNAFISLSACVLTGFCTSMLWPGNLILMEENIPSPGIAAYALMAAGGDLGASIAPQLMGIIVDKISTSAPSGPLVDPLLLPEQIGMNIGMLVTALFPIIGVFLLIGMKKYFKIKR